MALFPKSRPPLPSSFRKHLKRLKGKPMITGLKGKIWTSLVSWRTRRMMPSCKSIGKSSWFSCSRVCRYLTSTRNQRLAELSTIAEKSTFNQVYFIQKPDYPRDVTEASRAAFVCVHLSSSMGGNIESRLLTDLWREMARKFGDIKFCEMRGNMCIENYPEKNTPTILIYRNGDIRKQIVTLRELGGERARIAGETFARLF